MPKLKDYSGQLCGCWKVIERDKNPKSKSHETFWISECQNCGNIASVRKTDLDKSPQSCNNCKGDVISKVLSSNGITSWKVGDKYGLLTIIDCGKQKGKHTYVKVQCDCGSEPFEVRLEHLKGQNCHGRTISCGCINKSSGELKIKECLSNYTYSEQYIIPELSRFMPFDFAVFKDNKLHCLIEFDGEQHYRPIEHFGGEEKFLLQQQNDGRRDKYCLDNNIKLIRIPYYDYDKITEEYLRDLIES